jgi:hypothetical protein
MAHWCWRRGTNVARYVSVQNHALPRSGRNLGFRGFTGIFYSFQFTYAFLDSC